MVPYESFLILSRVLCVVVTREGPGQAAAGLCWAQTPRMVRGQASPGKDQAPPAPVGPLGEGLRDRQAPGRCVGAGSCAAGSSRAAPALTESRGNPSPSAGVRGLLLPKNQTEELHREGRVLHWLSMKYRN